jgi:hypothetical protein
MSQPSHSPFSHQPPPRLPTLHHLTLPTSSAAQALHLLPHLTFCHRQFDLRFLGGPRGWSECTVALRHSAWGCV